MKKFILIMAVFSLVALSACADEKPLTEKEQAEKHGMTMNEYKETKEAAARMNMTMDEHMKMMDEDK